MSKDKSEHAADSHAELKDVALAIYISEVRGKRSGFVGGKIALESFRLAREFLEMSELIEIGDESAARPAPDKSEFVDVELMQLVVTQQGESWVPVKGKDGKRLTEKQLQDPDAFAPNLGPDHPINQRSGPRAREALRLAMEENDARRNAHAATMTEE